MPISQNDENTLDNSQNNPQNPVSPYYIHPSPNPEMKLISI